MHASSLVTKMQPYLGMANSCCKMECGICDNLLKIGSGKMYLSTEAEVTESDPHALKLIVP